MKLHAHSFIFCVDKTECMTSESMHEPVTIRRSTITHYKHYLVKTFRIEAPEIPHHCCAFAVGVWISFLCMNKVAEFFRIFYKEDGRVVSHKIPVTFFGIKFYCKAAGISFCVGTSFFSSNS